MTQNTYWLRYEECITQIDTVTALLDRSGGPTACHPHRSIDVVGNGYGRVRLFVDGKWRPVRIHRFMYVIANKVDINSTQLIDHYVCHEPACGNPQHMRLTDHQGNAQSRIDAGRFLTPSRQFTDEQVIEFRQRYQAGESQLSLLKEAPTTYESLRQMLLGKSYKHLPLYPRPKGMEFGARGPAYDWTPETVIAMKQRIIEGKSIRQIAVEFDTTPSTIRTGITTDLWKEHGPTVDHLIVRKNRLESENVAIIKRRLLNGESYQSIAAEFNTTPRNIWRIDRGETWSDVEPAEEERHVSHAAD